MTHISNLVELPDNNTQTEYSYISPSGSIITLPKSYKPSFTGLTSVESLNKKIALGCLLGFNDGSKNFTARFKKADNGYLFEGYFEAYNDNVSGKTGASKSAKVLIGKETDGCGITISTGLYSGELYIDKELRKVLESELVLSGDIKEVANIKNPNCQLPDGLVKSDPLTYKQIFTSGVWAKYNYYKDGGLLMKYSIEGKEVYLYSNEDSKGNVYLYRYFDNIGWRAFQMPKPSSGLEVLSAATEFKYLLKVARESGHTALDIFGTIPVIGEVFDAVNAVWYVVQGDGVNASLCAVSLIPFVGDYVGKGGKAVYKSIKGIGVAIELTAEASACFARVAKKINASGVENLKGCLHELGVVLTNNNAYIATVEKLSDAITDSKQLELLLNKLNKLDKAKQAEFLADITKSENAAIGGNLLADNLDKIDEKIIESYQVLSKTSLKTDIVWLSRVSEWKQFELTFEQFGDVVQITSKEGDEIAQIIREGDNLNFEIADDYFVVGSFAKSIDIDIPVKAGEGDVVLGGKLVEVDGKVGFVEDVASYAASVQQTIRQRYKLRKALAQTAEGISKGQEAHHIIPVNLLKNNEVVQKAVEGGFDFNGVANGMAIDKYVKKTGAGRHANHPSYDNKILEVFQNLENMGVNLSPSQSKKLLNNLINGNSKYEGIKIIIKNSTNKLDDLSLNLDKVDVLDLLGD